MAHLLKIVHRDLKPKNIAVAPDGRPLVLDFGLAKFTHLDDASTSDHVSSAEHTVTIGKVKGTLAYMSPEQAEGNAVDCRTDVYALGVILYQLLTGHVPNDPTASALAPGRWHEYLKANPAVSIRSLKPEVPAELSAVVHKCLSFAADERYPDALALAGDLDAFLEGRPVSAVQRHRYLYVTRKFIAAHRVPFVAAATFFVILTLVITTAFFRVQSERNLAIAERQRAEDREAIARPFLYASEIRQAGIEWNNLQLTAAQKLLDDQIPTAGQADLRGFDWFFLRAQCAKRPLVLRGHAAGVAAVAMSEDERLVASGDQNGTLFLWTLEKPTEPRRLSGPKQPVLCLAFSPDTRWLAVGSEEQRLWLFDLEKNTAHELREPTDAIQAVRFSTDGKHLAAGDRDGFVYLWSITETRFEKKVSVQSERGVLCLDFSPDGAFLATGGKDSHAHITELATGQRIAILGPQAGPVHAIRFTPDGQFVATAGWDRSLRYWQRDKGFSLVHEETAAAEAQILGLEFSKQRAEVYVALANGRVSVRQPPPQYWSERTMRVEPNRLASMAVGCRGTVASTDGSPDITIHTPAELESCRTLGPEASVQRMALSPEGTLIATSVGTQFSLWEQQTGRALETQELHTAEITGLAFRPDGRHVVSLDLNGHLLEWGISEQKRLREHAVGKGPFACLAASPTSPLVALGGIGTVQVFNLETGQTLWRQKKHGHLLVNSLQFSPDGKHLVSGSWDNTVKVWDPEKGTVLRTLTGNDEAIFGIDIARDNSKVAAISRNGVTVVWNLTSGERLHTFAESRGSQGGIAFAPDGRLLAIATYDALASEPAPVVFYDLPTRIQTLTLAPPARLVRHLAFTRDGRSLLAGGQGYPDAKHGSVFAWEAHATPLSPRSDTSSEVP
jgi:WD40 repeat protein